MTFPDLWSLYALMLKSRLFEEAVAQLWHDGLIAGEMHLGTGEEAIIAGVVSQLQEGDALALDHRATAALLMRGVDPVLLLREFLGQADGLCHGQGGHMHLFSKAHLAASSGIVGASGPAAAGFGLAAQYLRPGAAAVAFFGEGAMNQGMLMEAMNLAAAWQLPVIFVCKDDNWSITTESFTTIGNHLAARATGLGLPVVAADGRNVDDVYAAAQQALKRARDERGPTFLHASCVHLEGHFLGYQLLRITRDPLRELPPVAGPLMRSFTHRSGGSLKERVAGLRAVLTAILATLRDARRDAKHDPVVRARAALPPDPVRLQALEAEIMQDLDDFLALALQEEPA